MNRNFLQEAIADAKAVKESAIANAKVALEEAFSPQVQAMFASKLEEMEKDEEVNEAYDDVDEAKDDEISEKKEYMTKKEKREGDDRKSDNKAETETEKMRKIKEEEEMDLDEILAELEKDEDLKENARTDAEEEGYKDGMKDEKEDLKKMKEEVEELKSELMEVNMLNAKLLYVNKIFRSKNLSESQKSKVLAAFDKATTVTEVKLVFETLSEGLTAKKSVVKENLGSASRAMGNAPKKKMIMEVDSQVERWQKLAGIKKMYN